MKQDLNNRLEVLTNNISEDYEFTFEDYYILFKVHFKKILLIIFSFTIFGIYYSHNIPPKYKATATVEIQEKPGENIIMDFSGSSSNNRMNNEIQIIKSRFLAKKVVEKLWNSKKRNNLFTFGTRKYQPRGEKYKRLILEILTFGLYSKNTSTIKSYDGPYTSKIGDEFAEKIISAVSVQPIKNTKIINISYTCQNADEARVVANLIASSYIKYDKEKSTVNAIKSEKFLDSLVHVQELKIEKKEILIKDFKLKNNLYGLEGNAQTIAGQLDQYEGELYNIESELNIRNEKIDILQSKLNEKEKVLTDQLVTDINMQLTALRLEISRLEAQIIQSKNLYGNEHEVVLGHEKRLIGLQVQLDEKVKSLITKGITSDDPLQARQEIISQTLNIESEIIGLDLKRNELKKLRDIFKEKLSYLPEKQLELSKYERDMYVLNQNYTLLRQKLEEAKINVAVKVGNVVMLDFAKMPKSQVGPSSYRLILIFFIIGIVISFLLVVLIEVFDKSLKTVEEIQRYDLSVLGVIPSIEPLVKDHFGISKKFGKSKKTIQRRLITKENPKSPISEAYRGLRTNLVYSTTKIKTLLISSAGPGEGKTTTVANLAITYANLGKKTLLVDTDLRRPVVHNVFGLEKEPGVTNFLSDQTRDIHKLVRSTPVENLSVITSGVIPPNPSEMLGSIKMREFIKILESNWDMVLFDSPPLVAVTDANLISKAIDQIILVVKVGQTDKKAFHHTVQNLSNINAPLGGIILNAVDNKSSYGSYYYYYYQNYYNYYGREDT